MVNSPSMEPHSQCRPSGEKAQQDSGLGLTSRANRGQFAATSQSRNTPSQPADSTYPPSELNTQEYTSPLCRSVEAWSNKRSVPTFTSPWTGACHQKKHSSRSAERGEA